MIFRRKAKNEDVETTDTQSGVAGDVSGGPDDGTGTTPTVMDGGYVNITDNADPMDLVVYRTAARLRRGQHRQVCRVPVFSRGSSANENSVITPAGVMRPIALLLNSVNQRLPSAPRTIPVG